MALPSFIFGVLGIGCLKNVPEKEMAMGDEEIRKGKCHR